MKKRFQKITGAIITAAITGSIIVSPFTKVSALPLDEIYAQAYKSTVNAMTVKTQKSINEARASIALLPKQLHSAIGEFSKQVDIIQHPFFVRAYQAILKAQTSPSQANINSAKASIDQDMPAFYRATYSQAVDIIQQKLMNEAKTAVDKAIKSKLKSEVDNAYKLIYEIKGALNTSIVDWAKLMEDRLTEAVGTKVISIKPVNNINVAYGTDLSSIALPKKISLNLSDRTTKDVDITWSCPEYNRYVSKTYTFVGSYELPDLVLGVKPEATVKVTVGSYYNPGSGGGGYIPPSQPLKIIDESNSELKEGLIGTYYIALRLKAGADYSKYSSFIKGTNTELKYDAVAQAFFYENAYGNIPNNVVVVVTEKSTGKTQEVTISVKEKESLEVVDIKPVNNINVAYGTDLSSIALPKKISLNLSNRTTKDVDVTWSCPEYDRYSSKTYTFVGSYELPNLVLGVKPEITVKVIVGEDIPPSQPLGVIDESNSELKEGLLGTYYIALRLKPGTDYSKYSSLIKGTNTELKYDAIAQAFFYENAYGNIPNNVVVVVTETSTGKTQEVTISVKEEEALDVVNSTQSILVEPLVGTYALKVTLKESYSYGNYTASIKDKNFDLSYDNEVKAFFYDNCDGEVLDSITIIITEKLTGRTQEIVLEML